MARPFLERLKNLCQTFLWRLVEDASTAILATVGNDQVLSGEGFPRRFPLDRAILPVVLTGCFLRSGK
jgi:hypothetical protein